MRQFPLYRMVERLANLACVEFQSPLRIVLINCVAVDVSNVVVREGCPSKLSVVRHGWSFMVIEKHNLFGIV